MRRARIRYDRVTGCWAWCCTGCSVDGAGTLTVWYAPTQAAALATACKHLATGTHVWMHATPPTWNRCYITPLYRGGRGMLA